jgi:tRNA A37 threonylcarbamoyladenosine dehydratase
MNDTRYGRFKDSPWFGKPLPPIIVGGAGGIGSWFMILLMRSGDYQVMLMDPDIVEESNLAGQFYTESDVGKTKVVAVSDHVDRMCGKKPGLFYGTERYLPHSEATPIMVSCFDNMQARQDMFANWETAG